MKNKQFSCWQIYINETFLLNLIFSFNFVSFVILCAIHTRKAVKYKQPKWGISFSNEIIIIMWEIRKSLTKENDILEILQRNYFNLQEMSQSLQRNENETLKLLAFDFSSKDKYETQLISSALSEFYNVCIRW